MFIYTGYSQDGQANKDTTILNLDHVIGIQQDSEKGHWKALLTNGLEMIVADCMVENLMSWQNEEDPEANEMWKIFKERVLEPFQLQSAKVVKEVLEDMAGSENRKMTPGKEMEMDRKRKIIDKYQEEAIKHGIDTERMHAASMNLKDAAKQATMGAFKKIDCFEAIGMALVYCDPVEQLFDEVIEALKMMEEGPKKGSIMAELFGPECIVMIPLCIKK